MQASSLSLRNTLLDRIGQGVQTINGYVLIILTFVMVACVTWQVIGRYVFSSSSTVTEELSRFCFMWIGLLGAAQAAAKRQHLAIDLMAMKLKGIKKRILTVFIESCVIFFSSMVMIKGGYMLAMRTFATKQISPALQIPMGYIYLIVPIAGALFILFALIEIYHAIKNDTKE